MAKGPYLPNVEEIIAAGINPSNGLPIKLGGNPDTLKEDIRKILRVMDEQAAVRRYKWYNLPDDLDGELLERILYYKGQAMFFFNEIDENFYFLPYALEGGLDMYGRYVNVKPLPFMGSSDNEKKERASKEFLLDKIVRKPQYSIKMDEVDYDKDFIGKCVLLHDYSKQISQTTLPRQMLNEPLINIEAECIPFMRTSMILGTGVKGMRVNDADQQDQVEIAARSMEKAAMTGKPWIPVVGNLDFQEITEASNLKGADYMQAMESLDNLRLSTYGIDNGGLFQKKAHMLETEQAQAGGSTGLIYQDGLTIRQKFCDIVNSIWGLGVWVEPSESVMGGDTNGDMLGYDVEDPMTSGGDIGGGSDETNV